MLVTDFLLFWQQLADHCKRDLQWHAEFIFPGTLHLGQEKKECLYTIHK